MIKTPFIPKSIVCLQNYSWPQLKADIGSGVVVGLVALPLAMAFAIASGVEPERGLFTAVVAGFIISALGGSRVQIGGPTGAFIVVISGIVSKFGYQGLAVATMMAGVLLIILGLCQLGSMVKFIPYPVTTGFTSGIAVIIFSGQIKDFLGLNMGPVPTEFFDKWVAYYRSLNTLNPWALGLAVFTIACVAYWPKSWRKIPGSIVALIVAGWAVHRFQLPVETIQSRFGSVPNRIPVPSFPSLNWDILRQLSPAALTIALLAAVESLLSAVVADGMIRGRHKSNMELVAQGIANIASPIFGGIAATGAIARTATNVKNGGRTPVAGMVHSLVLLMVLWTASGWAGKIPMACLAGILVVVSYHMSEWRSFRSLMAAPRSDISVLLVTFSLTVLIDLTVAVEVGMVLAAFLFMRRITELTSVRALAQGIKDSQNGEDLPESDVKVPQGVEVYSIAGSFSFGAANKLLEIDRITSKNPRGLILDLSRVIYMDATGLHVLRQMRGDCVWSGIRLIIAGIHAQPLSVIAKAGKLKEFGQENIKARLSDALKEFI